MFLLFASLVTLATAAPHTLPEAHFTYLSFKEYTRDILPDTKNLDNFNIAYDYAPWTIITPDNQYILSMSMTGYKKEDIMVLAHRGALVMKTVYKEEDIIKKSDLSMIILPRHVNPAGWWTYNDGVLKVVFPIYGKEKVGAIRDPGASDVTQIVLDSLEGFEEDLSKH